ncbi:iron complex transport system substrate-binding protein [Kytococcus aerolatus]|uniref:Iron complex transport system substrate-binding protein n=1 Tax=Kytococcus aerolatus TaxID=592308 RepID=A0A212U6D9_9MICO|nr:ABC transporter substrate-binding protein [Kytococcus aerolatus]SNC73823.1 iron complex transport system substrate-binding protein [Kytococcus aerolatus]
MLHPRRLQGLALLPVAALVLTACGSTAGGGDDEKAAESSQTTPASSGEGESSPTEGGSSEEGAAEGPVEIEDNFGTVEVQRPPKAVVATDNGMFETLDSWGVELVAAPKPIIPEGISYPEEDEVKDLGSHREPNLETLVAAQPDLVLNGGRFADFRKDIEKLVPEAALVELTPRDGEPLDDELKRQTTALGEIFGKQSEAKKLNEALDAEVKRFEKTYDPEQTVMSVIVSGGEIGYVAPTFGRTMGPLYDVLGLEPALEVEGASEDHQGDDISVEAIAKSNPDIILVMDRDAAVAADEEGYQPAKEIIESSEALQKVPAVKEGKVFYMPNDAYTNGGIETYTEFIGQVADGLEGK